MLYTKAPQLSDRGGILHSLRFELVFVLACGTLLPLFLAADFPPSSDPVSLPRINSLLAAGLSAIGLVLILRRLNHYPGMAVVQSILPVLGGLYGAVLAAFTVLQIDYSNRALLAGFFSTLAARYAIGTLQVRAPQLIYWIVPGGRVSVINDLPNMATLPLWIPSLPEVSGCAIIADLHADHSPEWERLLAEAAISGKPVYHYKQVWEAETGKVQIEHLSENSFGALVPSLTYQKLKRLVDLVCCVFVLPGVALMMLVTAILIKLDSPGPVFFLQRRMGFRGKVFNVIKFRTMTVMNDGEHREASITQAGDQRITKIGHFLRRVRLDELPQIVNIIRGEMSWIGPRPEAVSLSAWYEIEIPFYRYRHIVRPGITGWAQVNQGHVASLEEIDDKLQYDFYYIKNLSYWLDFLIVFRTLRVILSGFGAK